MAGYDQIPTSATLKPTPFKAHVDEKQLSDMKQLLALSPIGPAVFENTSQNQGETLMSTPARKYGMRRDWLANAKEQWLRGFDWRTHEDEINKIPNFMAKVTGDDGIEFDIHFLALFSEKKDAVPLAFYHGWPGSFLEFMKILNILKERYSPKDLPYHVIVPSLPGYAFSSGPPVDVNYTINQASNVLHHLMVGLGFKSGYVSQGGDLGSFIARDQAASYDECKSMHLNMCGISATTKTDGLPMTKAEKAATERGGEFMAQGFAYAMEHGTRTGTIGLALSASPLAMLSWIGEKFLEWSDEDPSVDEILQSVSLYWLTDTFPRCIYPYRGIADGSRPPPPFIEKASGYSFFPKEIVPRARSVAEQTMNLVAFSAHERGGHFAALERPQDLLEDVEKWIALVWK
ncbi:alpha/beta-hydrolase [Acrodontium crateriforme]|uniref:Alpha/beta-hydrolase n=1 Tax=Acrodontium crateriforme TaxID=150365 RepID=A0AAQ3M1A5_9PEZI|nr:alpha/beta-hydrolase [Acrodontium crateriforme]